MENKTTSTPVLRPLDDTDVTTWNLPEGATTRLGTGWISGGMTFSPDGESLVVASTIGCWWYDINTMRLSKTWDTEQGILCDITFSQDGKWLATGSWNGTVKIWDTQNLECAGSIDLLKSTNAMSAHPRNLLFSQDGKYITCSNLISRDIGGGSHFTIYDWQTNIDTPIKSLSLQPEQEKRHVQPTALSPDGSLVAYTPETNITSVMHVETGEHIAKLRDNYTDTSTVGCNQLVFSPCGEYLAACNRGNKVHVWNVNNGTLEMAPTVYGDNRRLEHGIPAFMLDGNLRVAGFSSREVVIWDRTQQKTVDSFEASRRLSGCFSSDGTRFAIRNRHGELQLWTQDNPSTVKSLTTHLSRGVVDVRFSKDSRTLLSCHDPAGYRLWDIAERQVKQVFHSPFTNSLGVISTSRSRELLASVEEKKVIRVWNLVSDKQIAELTEKYRGVTRITFSPTEEHLVTTNIRKIINIWDLASSTQIAELSQNPSRVNRMGFSRTGEYFVGFYGDSFTIWDTTRWEKRHDVPLPEQRSKRWKLLFHPNNNHLITSMLDGPTLVWDLKNGEQIGELDTTVCLDTSLYKATQQNIQKLYEQPETAHPRLWTLRFSRCGTLIAGGIRHGKMGEIRFWDATTLETRTVIIPPTGCQRPQRLKFSPCGKYLAVGAQWQDGQERISVRLWDVNTGENVHTFWGHPTDVWSLDFSLDGNLLASGSYDGTILLWDMKPFINC